MQIFWNSLSAWWSERSVNSAIMMVMMVFMVIGAVDKILGNRHGYGEKFEAGFRAIGPLALSMVGVVAAAPVMAKLLGPIVTPVYRLLGADPSMFATTLLACDMGGYPLAMELAETPDVGTFAGLILGTMMGPTVVFTIPVAFGVLEKEDHPYLGAGAMAGLITIPVGCAVGGLMMNWTTEYSIPVSQIFLNLLPVLLIAGLLALGLWCIPGKMIRGFQKFGSGVTVVIIVLTAIAVFEQITGICFPVLDTMATPDANGLTPLDSGLLTCGHIGIVLIGAFPMVEWLTRTFQGLLSKIGSALGINENASAGMIACLAHVIAALSLVQKMDPKGKLMTVAFAVSAASVFGAHLGFTAGIDQSMVAPVIVGKLTAGFSALLVAHLLAPSLLSKIQGRENAACRRSN